ncbi:MAG TPA: hypothetical protein VHB68_06050 [Steroidobacteraceae bacterium]|nr:hypothetical protein [Steroidobacteraceae bacterium]
MSDRTSHFPELGDDSHAFMYASSCEQARLIEPYVSCRLRTGAQARFELHLFACERCLRAVEFELLVKRAVADFARFAHFSRSWH